MIAVLVNNIDVRDNVCHYTTTNKATTLTIPNNTTTTDKTIRPSPSFDHAKPQHTTLNYTTPHYTASHHTTSHHATTNYTTPHKTKPQNTTLHHTTPYLTTPHHAMLHHATPHHTTPHHATPHHTKHTTLTVIGWSCRACRMKLETTLPSFMCMRGPKVLKIRATLTSTPSCGGVAWKDSVV